MSESMIIDPRPLEVFKEKTFSEYKKREVYSTLFKCIEQGKVEDACYWATECIVSGYSIELYDKLFLLNSKLTHINSPNLPAFLWRRFKTFEKTYNHISQKEKNKLIHLRNTSDVRNNIMDIIVTITMAPKQNRHDKLPKINESSDFLFHNIKNKLTATMQLLPSHIIRFTDPEELKIIMNEIFFHLKNKNGGYEQAIYWICWLLQWEKKNKKEKRKFEIEERNIHTVKSQYCKDIIWLVWEIIFEETNLREENIKQQIKSLFSYFRNDFTTGKRNSRLIILYHSIGYLTLPLDWNIPIRTNKTLFLVTQCNIHKMFLLKKEKEVKHYTEIQKPKKIKGKLKEIIEDRMNQLNEIDQIIF